MKLNPFKKIHWIWENAWVNENGNGIPSSFAEKVHVGWRFDVIAFILVADDMCTSALFFCGYVVVPVSYAQGVYLQCGIEQVNVYLTSKTTKQVC